MEIVNAIITLGEELFAKSTLCLYRFKMYTELVNKQGRYVE